MNYKINNLGEYFKNIRKEKSIKIAEVARELCLTSGYISRIENGTSNPSLAVLVAMCKFYNIDINEIAEVDIPNSSSTDLVLELADLLSADTLQLDGKETSITDRRNILLFARFLAECESTELKQSVMNIVLNLKK